MAQFITTIYTISQFKVEIEKLKNRINELSKEMSNLKLQIPGLIEEIADFDGRIMEKRLIIIGKKSHLLKIEENLEKAEAKVRFEEENLDRTLKKVEKIHRTLRSDYYPRKNENASNQKTERKEERNKATNSKKPTNESERGNLSQSPAYSQREIMSDLEKALFIANTYANAEAHRNHVQNRFLLASEQRCNYYKDYALQFNRSNIDFTLGTLTTALG